ncbi:MAG: hypothetical protein HFG40_02545 [Bacilli bacterium]|nr:hypothetical protein [Bacilli bacterium]
MVRVDGYIDINQMLEEIGISEPNISSLYTSPLVDLYEANSRQVSFSFNYHGISYFFKYARLNNGVLVDPYNELIAEELAHDFGLPCAEYDLAVFQNRYGVISKDFRKEGARYLLGTDIFQFFLDYYDCNLEGELKKYRETPENTLDDIWDTLEIRYHGNREIISHLMRRIVGIYLFDIITCQIDRHDRNWQIMESSDGVDIAPLYDNERILLDTDEEAEVCLGMDLSTYFAETIYFAEKLFVSIQRFLRVSSEEFSDILLNKLWIIGEENLHSVFERVEKKTGHPMPSKEKLFYLTEYKDHKKRLEETLSFTLKKESQDEGKNR